MKSHHLLALLVLSLCSYAAKNIITYYSNKTEHTEIANRNSVNAPNKGIITAVHVSDEVDRPATIESPGKESYSGNSTPDVKMADPGEEITLIEPPSANQMGNAVMTFPIKLPAGRNKMEPQLTIQYNSDGGNGWLGLDWNLQTDAIMIETRWGVPRYNSSL